MQVRKILPISSCSIKSWKGNASFESQITSQHLKILPTLLIKMFTGPSKELGGKKCNRLLSLFTGR